MALKAWIKDGKLVVDPSGKPILCETCPCTVRFTCPCNPGDDMPEAALRMKITFCSVVTYVSMSWLGFGQCAWGEANSLFLCGTGAANGASINIDTCALSCYDTSSFGGGPYVWNVLVEGRVCRNQDSNQVDFSIGYDIGSNSYLISVDAQPLYTGGPSGNGRSDPTTVTVDSTLPFSMTVFDGDFIAEITDYIDPYFSADALALCSCMLGALKIEIVE